MKKEPPEKLYQYCSIDNNYHWQNLENNVLWFSKPGKFNDPFDCSINFRIQGITSQSLKDGFDVIRSNGSDKAFLDKTYLRGSKTNKYWKIFLFDQFDKLTVVNRERYQEWGVVCLSERVDNILMWSHYATGHKGYCLEFDTKFPPFNIPNAVFPVDYSSYYPSVTMEQLINGDVKWMPFKYLTTKSSHWKYEKEWRLLTYKGDTPYVYDISALTGIYLGCRMPYRKKNRIIEMFANIPTVRIYKMEIEKNKFKLKPVQIPKK